MRERRIVKPRGAWANKIAAKEKGEGKKKISGGTPTWAGPEG